jgi:hypothetical protein
MEWMILAALAAAVVALAFWAKSRRKRGSSSAPPAVQPLTPEEVEQRKFLGEEWERWKRDNNIKGP